jgi:hypothetical protein
MKFKKLTLSFHINTMINQHRDLYREMNTRDLNLEQVYREINVTNVGRIIAYLAFMYVYKIIARNLFVTM